MTNTTLNHFQTIKQNKTKRCLINRKTQSHTHTHTHTQWLTKTTTKSDTQILQTTVHLSFLKYLSNSIFFYSLSLSFLLYFPKDSSTVAFVSMNFSTFSICLQLNFDKMWPFFFFFFFSKLITTLNIVCLKKKKRNENGTFEIQIKIVAEFNRIKCIFCFIFYHCNRVIRFLKLRRLAQW